MRVSRGRLALLAVASLIAPAVRIVELLRGRDLEPFTTVIPTVILFVLVMARLSGPRGDARRPPSAATRRPSVERQRSEQRFGSLVQHASDVVTVVDEDGEITFQSPSVRQVLGYQRDALVGTPLSDLIHEDDREAALELLSEVSRHPHRDAGVRHVPLAPRGRQLAPHRDHLHQPARATRP